MRDAVVRGKLDALRVDHDEAHLVRRRAHEDAHNHRIDCDRLARTRGAADKQVRHLREVKHHFVALDVFADGNLKRTGLCCRQDIAEKDVLTLAVRHLDANVIRSGDRREDAHSWRGEGQCDVIGEVRHLVHANAGWQIDFEERHRRTGNPPDNLDRHAEVFKRLLQQLSGFLQDLVAFALLLTGGGLLQQTHAREHEPLCCLRECKRSSGGRRLFRGLFTLRRGFFIAKLARKRCWWLLVGESTCR